MLSLYYNHRSFFLKSLLLTLNLLNFKVALFTKTSQQSKCYIDQVIWLIPDSVFNIILLLHLSILMIAQYLPFLFQTFFSTQNFHPLSLEFNSRFISHLLFSLQCFTRVQKSFARFCQYLICTTFELALSRTFYRKLYRFFLLSFYFQLLGWEII